MIIMDGIVDFLKTLGVGPRAADDPFFNDTYETCKLFERLGVTVEDEEELCHEVMKEFKCNACNDTFQNLLDYEMHYHNSHLFVCTECKKWRPTARLLEIHVQEAHDSFFKVLADRQPMYQCFVSICTMKFKDSVERKEHCIDAHVFPKNYRFYFNHNDMTAKSNKSTENESAMETDQNEPNDKREHKIYFENSKQKTFKNEIFRIPKNVKSNSEDARIGAAMKPVTMFIPRQVQRKSNAKNLTQGERTEKEVLMEIVDALPNLFILDDLAHN